MSAGYGPPVVNTFGMITGLGDAFTKSYDTARKEKLTSDLGGKIKTGDYAGAAQAALDAGDIQTGLALAKMGETRGANQQLSETLGGLFGGGQSAPSDAGTGTFGDMTQGRQDRSSLPSFSDTSGPAGGYVANLFKRESNNNTMAQAPTSSARGLGQFTKDTWNGVARKYPDLALTPVAGGQDGRIDPDQMLRATKAFTAENEAILGRANLPVNDATRYSLHFLGAGGGPKFVAGAMSNPDAPAIGFVAPGQVRANRNIFFGKDGRPKTAGEVLSSFGASFGGGQGGGGRAPASPAMPSTVLASADEANLPVAGGQTAAFQIPPAASPDRVMTMPSDVGGGSPALGAPAPHNATAPGSGSPGAFGAGDAQASFGAPAAPAAPSAPPAPGVPGTSSPAWGVAGTMASARIPIRNIADVNRTAPGSPERVKALIRASLIPGLSEQQQGLVKSLLANEQEQAKLTTDQREYALAQSQGFRGGFLDYKNAVAGRQDEGAKISSQVKAREAELIARGLDPNTPSHRRYTFNGTLPEEGFTLSAGQTRFEGGREVASVPDRDKSIEGEAKLRTEFTKQLGSFGEVQDGYRRLIAATEQREANPSSVSPASDIGLIFGYMKMLDPGSVVREGEYATAQNAAGIPARVMNAYNKALSGEFLTPDQRQDFVDTAGRLYGQARQGAESVAGRYRELAKGQGLDEGRVVRLPDGLTGPRVGGRKAEGTDGSAPPTKFDPAKTAISMEDGKALKAALDTAENRQLFDSRYGEGAALAILKRPLAGATSSAAAGASPAADAAAPAAPRTVQVGRSQQRVSAGGDALPKGEARQAIPSGQSAGAAVAEARAFLKANPGLRPQVQEQLRAWGIDPKRVDQ